MGGSAEVNHRSLSVGARDATTGHRAMSFSDRAIDCLEFSQGTRRTIQGVGVYAAEDKMFLTADPVNHYDQIEPRAGEYYLVESIRMHWGPTPDNFLFRELQCSSLPLWQAVPSTATWTTSPDDPRSRIKSWIDTNTRNASITENDGATQAAWDSIFKNPPYPLRLEYRTTTSPVMGLYAVGQPLTTPTLGHDLIPYGYEEHVPIFIDTVDSTDCSGEQLLWDMEAELRYVFENFHDGSYLGPTARRPDFIDLGGERLFELECGMVYVRDTTT